MLIRFVIDEVVAVMVVGIVEVGGADEFVVSVVSVGSKVGMVVAGRVVWVVIRVMVVGVVVVGVMVVRVVVEADVCTEVVLISVKRPPPHVQHAWSEFRPPNANVSAISPPKTMQRATFEKFPVYLKNSSFMRSEVTRRARTCDEYE